MRLSQAYDLGFCLLDLALVLGTRPPLKAVSGHQQIIAVVECSRKKRFTITVVPPDDQVVKSSAARELCERMPINHVVIMAACQGHGAQLDLGVPEPSVTRFLVTSDNTDILGPVVHGTRTANRSSIQQTGLCHLSRQAVHLCAWSLLTGLTSDPRISAIAGMRHQLKEHGLFVYLKTQEAVRSGLQVFLTVGGTVLVYDNIPADLLVISTVHPDDVPRGSLWPDEAQPKAAAAALSEQGVDIPPRMPTRAPPKPRGPPTRHWIPTERGTASSEGWLKSRQCQRQHQRRPPFRQEPGSCRFRPKGSRVVTGLRSGV